MRLKLSRSNIKIPNFKHILKWIIIPICLLCVWIILSFVNVKSNLGITVLTHDYSNKNITSRDFNELLAGQKIVGEFEAKDNHLGIVAVRFNTFFRINHDTVRFKIKERGNKNWYYQHDYTTPQFQPNQLFTFGFPIIAKSSKKIYQFEIESLRGEPQNAVSVSSIEPVFIAKHQYARDLILSKREYATEFLHKKLMNTITNSDFLVSSAIYSFPLILYLIWLLFYDKYLSRKYSLSLLPIVLMIFAAFFDFNHSDTAIFGLTVLWLIFSYVYKLRSSISLQISLIFILLSLLFTLLSIDFISKSFTSWGYMILVVAVIQLILEIRWKDRELLDITLYQLMTIGYKKTQ